MGCPDHCNNSKISQTLRVVWMFLDRNWASLHIGRVSLANTQSRCQEADHLSTNFKPCSRHQRDKIIQVYWLLLSFPFMLAMLTPKWHWDILVIKNMFSRWLLRSLTITTSVQLDINFHRIAKNHHSLGGNCPVQAWVSKLECVLGSWATDATTNGEATNTPTISHSEMTQWRENIKAILILRYLWTFYVIWTLL